jgi:predicted metal-dependent peptidase
MRNNVNAMRSSPPELDGEADAAVAAPARAAAHADCDQPAGGNGRALHEHRATRAIQLMVEYAPSTGGLALWIHHRDVEHDDGPELAANDGATIFYGPDFETLTLPVQVGIVAHQVLHVALQHAQRRAALSRLLGDVDAELYNICADAIVNSTLSHLSWLELPQGSILLEDLLATALDIRQGVEKSLLEWDLERLYRAVDDRRSRGRMRGARRGAGNERAGERSGGQGGDRDGEQGQRAARDDGPRSARARLAGSSIQRDLLPAADSERPELEAEQAREWHERITRAHAGDGAHSMLRELIADLPKVRTPWEHLLRTLLARGLSHQPDLSWSRPARSYLANQGRSGRLRMPWEPGVTASKAVARLAVMVDVSGSIEAPLLARFAAEIEAITRRLEAGIVVIIGDACVSAVEHFAPGRSNLRDVQFQGGGGTDFSPLLREAERYAPDIGVFLTDLDGPAAYRPSFPVIWAVPVEHQAMPHPFGRKLVLD